MIRLAPLITAELDTSTLPGGKATDAGEDFLALLAGALASDTLPGKATPKPFIATPTLQEDNPKSDILPDTKLPLPFEETLPVVSEMLPAALPPPTLKPVAAKETVKEETHEEINEDAAASISALFAMLPGYDPAPKVAETQPTALPVMKPGVSANPAAAPTDDTKATPAAVAPLTPAVAETAVKATPVTADAVGTPVSPANVLTNPLVTPPQTQPAPAAAAPVLSAPLGSNEWQQSLSQHISLFTRQGQQSAELRLHPQDLGEVQITLKLDDNQAQIQMVSPHQHVRAALEAALPILRTQLAESGIQLGQSNVSGESFSGQQQASSQQQQRAHNSGNAMPDSGEDDALPVPTLLQTRVSGSNGVDIFA